MVAPGCARPNTPRSDPKSWAELAEPLRSRAHQLAVDFGLVLVSGYRDSGRQWDLRRERCPGRECSSSCKGYPVTARPGTSDHEKRTAADLGGRHLVEAMAQRERYGLALTVPSEIWHVSADRRDVRTGRVHNRPTVRISPFGQLPAPVDPNAGRVWREFAKGATDLGIYTKAEKPGQRYQVSELQMLLAALGHYRRQPDGVYGPVTLSAVIAFKDAASWRDRSSTVDVELISTLKTLVSAL